MYFCFMKILGIIAEYNPFHKGHMYHIQKAKELTGADVVVIAMSGHVVQRGDLAICDKWKRGEMAIHGGADLVIELTVVYSGQSAEHFARGGVELLECIGADYLAFGTESEDIDNYICKYNNVGIDITKKYKNNIEYMEYYSNEQGNVKSYLNFKENKNTVISEKEKIIIIQNNITSKNDILRSNKENFEKIANLSEKYKYIGEETYNGNKCIVIEITYTENLQGWYFQSNLEENNNDKDNEDKIKNKIWITKENGVITKVENENKKMTLEYDYQFNCVTNEDVQVPNLSGYKVIDTRKE